MESTRTLPAWPYRSAAFFEAEKRAIWTREWLLVGHVGDIERPGDFVSMTIAGEPVLAVRDHDGALRAFSNLCRHLWPLACEALRWGRSPSGLRPTVRSAWSATTPAQACSPSTGRTRPATTSRGTRSRSGTRDCCVSWTTSSTAWRPPTSASRSRAADNELTERVQEGLGSSLYRAGVLSARENGLKHFHDLIRAAIPAASLDDEPDGLAALAAHPVSVPT
jgi:Rieske [2Fe-2S] domain